MAKIHFIYFDIDTGSYPGVNHGLASLTAVLREDGHTVSLHHLYKLEPEDNFVTIALRSEADIIGFSFATNQRGCVDKYSRAIYSKMKILQIAGGIHPTMDPIDTLKIGYIKGVCIGEGENSLRDVLKCIDNKQDYMGLPGFWWRQHDGIIVRNQIPPLEEKISKFPYPDYSVFDTNRIASASSGWISMMLVRGCPYDCYYCCNHVLRSIYPNKKYYLRFPEAEYAIDIIKHNLTYYNKVNGINFADDLLIYREMWFEKFSALYKAKIGLPYTCNGRIEHFTDNILAMLKKSGCKVVYVGIESGNEWVRKNLLNRRYSNKEVVDCFARIRRYGISTFAYNILGFPFETKKQMRDTLCLNKKVKPTMGAVFYFYPYPGTRLFNICKEYDLLSDKMEGLSGYLEKPAITLTHCTEKDCIQEYNRLRLFLVSCGFVNSLKLPEIFGQILYLLLNVCSKFWVNLITKNSGLKYQVRKLFYRYRFR